MHRNLLPLGRLIAVADNDVLDPEVEEQAARGAST
jgi:hypothetical protein